MLAIQSQVPDLFLFGPFLDVHEEERSGLFLLSLGHWLHPRGPAFVLFQPAHRPKTPAPNTVALAIRAPAHELQGGETNLQPVTHARAGT